MKGLILKVDTSLAFVLPLTASAAEFGDFKVGQSFTLKVIKVTSTQKTGYFGVETKAPVPGTVPKFKKNASINFTIGAKGKLMCKGLSIPFAHSNSKQNEYNFFKEGTVTLNRNAEIDKSATKKPKSGKLSFFITDYSGAEPEFRTVIYELD